MDDTFLLTVKELDHYSNRPPQMRYRGAWTQSEGTAPIWPAGAGRKVFAYLKPFAQLPALLQHLKLRGCPTLVYMERPDDKLRQEFSTATLHFSEQRLNLAAVSRECDLAIVHGTHGSTFQLLLAGKPTLQLPLYLEQGLFATAVCKMGAALQPPLGDSRRIAADLDRMLDSVDFANAARAFAQRHTAFDTVAENEQMVARLEELAALK